MKQFFFKRNVFLKVENFFEKSFRNPYSCCFLLGIICNIAIETLSRKSVIGMGRYLLFRPHIFFYNSLLIAFTLSFALLVRKRVFAFTLLSLIWVIMGLTNSVLLVFRTTPFTAVDLQLIESALAIVKMYFTFLQLVLLGVFLLATLAGLIILYCKTLKQERLPFKKSGVYILVLFFLLRGLTWTGTNAGLLGENFGNINQAFQDYGFPYGFSCSLVNTGIDKPKAYSLDNMEELLEEVTKKPIAHNPNYYGELTKEEDDPNIIYLQLESFFDPSYVKGVSFSQNPLPFFTELKKSYSSGFLSVPSIGAGTANTEFEVITGMNLDFFGPGEYPYKTILKETTCESIAYNMKELDYRTHAIHNNEGTFYGRNQVFSQLGFDTFTSMEYMRIRETTPMGWPKDEILTGEIRKALKSTKEKDLIYTISVQGHGSYPEQKLENPIIQVSGLEEEGQNNAFEYYVNQLYEMDQFLSDLVSMLRFYPEKVVLILYGDHLPGFGFTDQDLKNGTIYQTEYVIWSNYGLEKQDRNLEAYQLSAYVMKLLGLQNGILTKYHQLFETKADYLEGLEMLEYDMLYGEQKVYDGKNPYPSTDLKMGTEPVQIYTVNWSEEENCILVRGKNFTEYSHITINEKEISQEFTNSFQIKLYDVILHDKDLVQVSQIGRDRQILSTVEKRISQN